jgi:hypothetical protein
MCYTRHGWFYGLVDEGTDVWRSAAASLFPKSVNHERLERHEGGPRTATLLRPSEDVAWVASDPLSDSLRSKLGL